jgi:hypothetical protein
VLTDPHAWELVRKCLQNEIDRLQAELTKALRDAERYRTFRQLVKDDHVLAQSFVWNAHPSRKKFDKFVDAEKIVREV